MNKPREEEMNNKKEIEMEDEKTLSEMVEAKLIESKDEIIKNGIAGVKSAVEEQVKWKVGCVIEKQIESLFEDEEVKKTMADEVAKLKVVLVTEFASKVSEIMPDIAVEMAKKMKENAIKNITEDSYTMRDVYKNVFGG
jgi:hypothetical protein